MPWVAGGLLILGSLALQVWPRRFRPLYGIDVWRHFLIARYLRAHGHLPGHGELPNHLFPEGTDYPPLFRILVASIPEKWWMPLQCCLAPLFDACHALTLLIGAYCLTGDGRLALAAVVAYGCNPLIVLENSNLSSRSFSSLLFTWTVGALIAWWATGQWGWLALGVGLMALLLLSHRLAVQALAVLLALFGIVEHSWRWPGLLLAAMALAVVLSGGFYLQVLRGHVLMLAYWAKNSANRYAHLIRGFTKPAGRPTDFALVVYRALSRCPAIAVFAGFPMAFLALAAVWLWRGGVLPIPPSFPPSALRLMAAWTVGLLAWGVLVRQIPPLRFLGEGERYGEYAAFPAAILTSLVVGWGINTSAAPFVWGGFFGFALVAGILPAIVLQQRLIVRDVDRSVTDAHRQIYETVCQEMRRGPVRLMAFPHGLVDPLTYFTDCPVLATDSSLAHWRYYSDFSPVFKKPVWDIVQRFRITHLLVSDRFVTVEELRLPACTLVACAGPLQLLRVSA